MAPIDLQLLIPPYPDFADLTLQSSHFRYDKKKAGMPDFFATAGQTPFTSAALTDPVSKNFLLIKAQVVLIAITRAWAVEVSPGIRPDSISPDRLSV